MYARGMTMREVQGFSLATSSNSCSSSSAPSHLGKIVELTDKRSLVANPQHPYTEALLAAVPVPDPKIQRKP